MSANKIPFGITLHHCSKPKYIPNQYNYDDHLLHQIYKTVQTVHKPQTMFNFLKYIFDPEIWQTYWNLYHSHSFDASKIKGMRILIQIGSIHAILNQKYYIYHSNSKKVQTLSLSKKYIIKSVKDTKMYFEKDLFTNLKANHKKRKQNRKRKQNKKRFTNNKSDEEHQTLTTDHSPIIDEEKIVHPPSTNTNSNKNGNPKLMVIEGDILQVAKWAMMQYPQLYMSAVGKQPVILVMASRSYPGGGYLMGAGAQEEDICRRTSLICNLCDPYHYCGRRSWEYPLPEFGGIYSPNVMVFRESVHCGYKFYSDRVFRMSFINVYAYQAPNLEICSNSGEYLLSNMIKKRTIRKLQTIFNIAVKHKHLCIILSAFGCGAYENPPRNIAQLFWAVLYDEKYGRYAQYFRMVIFAILDDKNTGKEHNREGNVKPFADVFKVPIVQLKDLEEGVKIGSEKV